MRKKLFLFLALLCIGLIFPVRSFATNPVDSGADDKNINRVGSKAAQSEIDSYMKATNDCSTPSLECLVKNTYTFLQIEMSVNIVGNECALITEDGQCQAEAPNQTNSTNTGTPVATNYKRGFVGDMYSFMGNMYKEKPAATSAYVADVFNSANIATPAYAQGLGFAALDPILELWKKFRNIAYIGFIFIFIVIGFMIMFRAKIGGQTAVTAQQAIPSVIVSLIFVTFSYAIAGLMIDFMYVIMYMMVGLFSGEVGNEVINYSIFQLAGDLFWSSLSGAAFEANKNIITGTLESAGGSFAELAGVGGYLGGLTITIVLSIAILIATVKLFFELLKSYASVVMNVVISPLILMVGAIPGKSVFKPWIQGLIGNLAAFPTVLLMLIIFKEFTGPISGEATGGFVPPFIINLGLPNSIAYIMGFAIILALPEVVTKVKKGLGANDGFGFEIAKAAMDRTKQAWSGNMPLGLNGKNITGLAAGAALTPMAAGGGALIGGAISKARGGSFAQGAKQGAIYGGLGGAIIGTGGQAISAPVGLMNKVSKPIKNINEAYNIGKTGWTSLRLRQALGTPVPPVPGVDETTTQPATEQTTTANPIADSASNLPNSIPAANRDA